MMYRIFGIFFLLSGFFAILPQCFIGITHNVVKQPVKGNLQRMFPYQAAL